MREVLRILCIALAVTLSLISYIAEDGQAQLTIESVEEKDDRITVEWSQTSISPGIFEKYELIRYRGCGAGRTQEKTLTVLEWDTLRLTDDGLSPDTQYSYQVGAYRIGEGFPAETSPIICTSTTETPITLSIGWGLIGIGATIIAINIVAMIFIGRPSFIALIIGIILVMAGVILLQVS